MSLLKRILLIFFLLIPISNSFASVVTLVDSLQVSNGHEKGTVRAGLTDASDKEVGGVQFNADGSKMFVRFFRDEDGGGEAGRRGGGVGGSCFVSKISSAPPLHAD